MIFKSTRTMFSYFKFTKHSVCKLETQSNRKYLIKSRRVEGRNIEIKASIGSDEELKKRLEIAKILTKSSGVLSKQHDVFFNSQSGRLKLRYLEPPECSYLVYYDRPDMVGPKLTKYNKIELDRPELMEKILIQTNGMRGNLYKKRFFFLYERTCIHLDKVKNLGNFIEFEVCLLPKEGILEGKAVIEQLRKEFGVKDQDLVAGAYFDKLKKY